MDGKSRLSMLYSNVQSLKNKMNELRAVVSLERPDIIALTETWTNEGVDNAFLQIEGYEIVERRDRVDTAGGRGGGIVVYVRGIHAWRENTEGDFNQCVTVRMKKRSDACALHVVYRSPNSSSENDMRLCQWMEGVTRRKGEEIFVGDFNFPGIDWEKGTSDARGRLFHETCMDSFLTQHVNQETHRSGHVLDLVLTTHESMVDNIRMKGKLGSSDHEMIMVDLVVGVEKNETVKSARNYRRGNYVEMRKEMSIDWERELREMDTEETWNCIEGWIQRVTEKHVPMKKITTKRKPMWMDSEVAGLIKEKRAAWTRWKQTRSEQDKKKYKALEAKTKKAIRNRKNALERQIAKNAKENPKAFYSYLNSQRKTRTRVGPLRDEDGQVVTDPRVQADMFNAHYASVFTRCTTAPPTIEKITEERIEDADFSVETIKDLIDNLKENSSPGPDGISNRVLKELRDELALPLQMLFRKSLDESSVPRGWKESIISPIYKKGDKGAPVNYRPVNLTSSVCKIMERVLKKPIEEHMEKHVLKNSQHGFRSGRSPQTNLIEFMDKVTKWIDEGKSVDILYFDLSKAFDKVDHGRLEKKMEAAGIGGKLKRWICEWLRERKQFVRVDGVLSGEEDVGSSVPQGTVLGGILFSIYIRDVDDEIVAFARKFADDMKAANVVETEEDAERMQRDIDVLVQWARDWGMLFNADKCKVMHLGRRNLHFEYYMDGDKIMEAEEEKDLGVWFGKNMKPTLQCDKAAKQANATLGLITRTFHYRTKKVLVPLYKTFVRPKMEHAVCAWRPWQQGEIDCLEKVQRRMVKMLCDVRGSDYQDRLRDVGLTTLEERRERGDMVETYKTLRGKNRVEKNEWFEAQEEDARPTRANATVIDGETVKKREVLVGQRANLEIRRNFFNVRVVNSWNRLPEEVKSAQSTNAFKNAYDGWIGKQQKTNHE